MAAALAVPAWAAAADLRPPGNIGPLPAEKVPPTPPVNPTTIITITIAPPPPPEVNAAQIGQILGGLRLLPPTARRGTVQGGLQLPFVTLNDKIVRLTPGAAIYDQSNRTIVHGQIPARKLDAVYTIDPQGQVSRIYILKPDERARLEPWFKK